MTNVESRKTVVTLPWCCAKCAKLLLISEGSDLDSKIVRTDIRVVALITWALSLALTAFGLLLLTLNLSHPNVHIFDYWPENTVIAVASSTVGAVIASRCPENPIGWLFCAIGLLAGVREFCAQYATYTLLAGPGSLPGGEAFAWVSASVWIPYLGLYAFLGLLFPNGRLPSSRWRWVAWLFMGVVLTGAISVALTPGSIYGLGPIHNPLGIEPLRIAGGANVRIAETLTYTLQLVAVISLFVRLRHANEVERQQLKWITYAAAVGISGVFLGRVLPQVASVPGISWAGFILTMAGVAGIPLATGMAILKYRLYDIDLIINRTLVYGSLTASVIGLYVLVVGGLGVLFQAQGNFAVSLLATGLVAVLFQTLRDRLQRGVNRLMYGERDEPYVVLSRLGQRLEATLAPDTAPKTIVETVAQALKLPYAAIALKQDDGYVTVAEHGAPVGEPVVLPLAYHKEQVGRLLLAPRAPGEAFTLSDRRLLNDLARQAGVVVHAVRLTADLQRSRERLVTAREEERRRVRRDLHDGLGPRLASLTLKHDAARNLLAHDPAAADALLAELKGQTQEAIADIRRLVYDLRPPALDQLGLVSAIRQQAANNSDGLSLSVEAAEPLPPLPAAVEVACYRIAQEAMTNVMRHARGARACRVRLSIDEAGNELELEITDNGVGLPDDRRAGVGMTSMRERAAELGGTCLIESVPTGGTRVLARLQLSVQET